MRINTRLQISAGLAIALALALALIFIGAARQVNEASKKSSIVDEIVKGLFELNVLTFDYLQHHEERAQAQWLLKHDSVANLLVSEVFRDPREETVLAKMRQNHEDIEAIFSRVVANRAAQAGAESGGSVSRELEERLTGQLSVKSQTIFSGAFQLAALNRADVVSAQQRAILLATVSIAVLVVIMASTAFLANVSIARPIARLTQIADDISRGNLDSEIRGFDSDDEIGILARAFKRMAEHLIEANSELERRVASRTQRLEVAASLGERLSAILDLEELLAEVVNRIKDDFNYYHAHIYLLDGQREKLIVVAGTGTAGAEMKTRRHNISLDAPTGLVARAARTGQIVMVDNVREAADWLPNPLLPDTLSEMAVPIILSGEGEVIGVLDVQQDKIAGLDEGDANLLRSLANQVAIAIRNARLFEEVKTALARTTAAQEKYIEQAWVKIKTATRKTEYCYARPGAPPLSEVRQQLMAEAKKQALSKDHVTVVALPPHPLTPQKGESDLHSALGDREEPGVQDSAKPAPEDKGQNVVVAPITLHNKKIGLLHLHPGVDSQQWQVSDLAMIQTVVDRFVETAENLRLFEETRARATREQTIRHIVESMRDATSLEDLVKATATALGERLSAGHVVVELGVEESFENGHNE